MAFAMSCPASPEEGHVLGKFGADEAALLKKVLERAASQMECWVDAGLQKAMNQFNGVVDPTNKA